MNIGAKLSRKGDKKHFFYDMGRGPGQRPAVGVFVYTKPKNKIERDHNKEAQKIIDTKKSQRIIEKQAIGTPFIPSHKFKANFIEYYDDYVQNNSREGNRHLANSFTQFKNFVEKPFVAPIEISENFCKRFRRYLLDKFNGETPLNYYARFKWVVNAATKEGYYLENPTEKVYSQSNPSVVLKEILECDEYIKLLATPFSNEEVKNAFIFCCYTGLRWIDVKRLRWADIKEGILTTRIIQKKTGLPVVLTLHPIALTILELQRNKAAVSGNTSLVFTLPTANGANKCLNMWMGRARVNKYITWSCARLSFSILLQDENVDTATVAYLMGHSTAKQVLKAYKRHRPKDQAESISRLPNPEKSPYFLQLAG